MIALDDEWTKATKEYNSLCTEELPDTIIASMAGDCSPEQNSKDAFLHAFALVDKNSLGDDHVRAAWNLLNGRRVMRRGLTSSDVDTTVPTLRVTATSPCGQFFKWRVSFVTKRIQIGQLGTDWICFLKSRPLSLTLHKSVKNLLQPRWIVLYQWSQLPHWSIDFRNGTLRRVATKGMLFKQRLSGPIGGRKSCGSCTKIATSDLGSLPSTGMRYDSIEHILYW